VTSYTWGLYFSVAQHLEVFEMSSEKCDVKPVEVTKSSIDDIIVGTANVSAYEEFKGCTVCGVDGAGY